MENNTKQTLSTPMAIVVAGFLIMIGILFSRSQPLEEKSIVEDNLVADELVETTLPPQLPKTNTKVALAPVSKDDHILGDLKTAKVVIVEFSDTECPFCKNFQSSIHKAIEKYPGKIAWVYRHFPLDMHPKALIEAHATECVASIGGNDAFWKYLDNIFEITPSNNGLDLKELPILAEKVGVDKTAFENCMLKNTYDAKIKAQMKDGMNAGLKGTPHSIIIAKDGTQYQILGADEQGLNTTLEALLN